MDPNSTTEYFDGNGHGTTKSYPGTRKFTTETPSSINVGKIRDFRLHKKTFRECPLIMVMVANKNTRVSPCCYKFRLLYLK